MRTFGSIKLVCFDFNNQMVIEGKKKDKFRIFRNGVRELLNLEGFLPP